MLHGGMNHMFHDLRGPQTPAVAQADREASFVETGVVRSLDFGSCRLPCAEEGNCVLGYTTV